MDVPSASAVMVSPGDNDMAPIPGFGTAFKLCSRDTGCRVAIVHPFAVGTLTMPHRHEYSIAVEGDIGFRSDDDEVVLGSGGYIVKPRGQMHAMWNAGTAPGRIIEVITPGGFEHYFRELSDLLTTADATAGTNVREMSEFDALAAKYGLTYGAPDWVDDIIARYSLNRPALPR